MNIYKPIARVCRLLCLLGTDQSKQPTTQTHVTVEAPTPVPVPAMTEPTNVLSVPAATQDRRPSIEMIPAVADLGRTIVTGGEALLASEEDSMSEADSPSGTDDHSEECW